MGRRKQSKPVKVSDSLSVTTSANSSASVSPNPVSQQQSKKTDFSIKSQLDSKPSTSNLNSFNPNLSPATLANALKAYNTLIKDLEKTGNLLKLTQEVNKLSYKDPNFKKSNNGKGMSFVVVNLISLISMMILILQSSLV